MTRARRSKSWWQKTVAQWRRSGQTAELFAAAAQISPRTLRWWSSALVRDTRAAHGSSAIVPIEIEVPRAGVAEVSAPVEIAVGDVKVRCAVGTDPGYVVALVRPRLSRLRASRHATRS